MKKKHLDNFQKTQRNIVDLFTEIQEKISYLKRISDESSDVQADEISQDSHKNIQILKEYCLEELKYYKQETRKAKFLQKKLKESIEENEQREIALNFYKENILQAKFLYFETLQQKDKMIQELTLSNKEMGKNEDLFEYSIITSEMDQSTNSLPSNMSKLPVYDQSEVEDEAMETNNTNKSVLNQLQN